MTAVMRGRVRGETLTVGGRRPFAGVAPLGLW